MFGRLILCAMTTLLGGDPLCCKDLEDTKAGHILSRESQFFVVRDVLVVQPEITMKATSDGTSHQSLSFHLKFVNNSDTRLVVPKGINIEHVNVYDDGGTIIEFQEGAFLPNYRLPVPDDFQVVNPKESARIDLFGTVSWNHAAKDRPVLLTKGFVEANTTSKRCMLVCRYMLDMQEDLSLRESSYRTIKEHYGVNYEKLLIISGPVSIDLQ